MYPCIELAGFAAAQAVCCLFDRQPLLPLAFSRSASAAPAVNVLSPGTPDAITAHGKQWLDANVEHADVAVVVYDGYVTIAGVRTDALLLELRSYRRPIAVMKMAVPYRPHHDPRGFAVYRPKFIVRAMDDQDDTPALTQAFFRGVFAHDSGGRIWKACADQSW